MSDPATTITRMDESLESLVALAADHTTTGALTLLDAINNTALTLCMRPGDVDRTGWVLYQAVTEIAYLREKEHTA